jgi:hypothetical protein
MVRISICFVRSKVIIDATVCILLVFHVASLSLVGGDCVCVAERFWGDDRVLRMLVGYGGCGMGSMCESFCCERIVLEQCAII